MKSIPITERFWPKVNKDGPIHPQLQTPCWLWTAGKNGMGYGYISESRVNGKQRSRIAHRVSYEWAKGSIPEDLQLDHLCRNHSCVNPDHLEAVTGKENLRRGECVASRNAAKTHCPLGHLLEGDNVKIYNGGRHCLACHRIEARNRYRDKHPEFKQRFTYRKQPITEDVIYERAS